ncbi:MAG: hypothetical protein OXU50_01770 [Gammaproteobacteria bacterium]|nr:hypothetical protein [Gammaproteobacteria bacterium]
MASVFDKLHKKLRFYTHKTKNQIPAEQGIYAWYLPLYILFDKDGDSMQDQLQFVNKTHWYEAETESNSFQAQANLNWKIMNINISVDTKALVPHNRQREARWREIIADKDQSRLFRDALLELSVFSPPLYIGQSQNLRGRYENHLASSSFHNRVCDFFDELDVSLRVEDLVFACVPNKLPEKDRDLLEFLLLRMSVPPFSKK